MKHELGEQIRDAGYEALFLLGGFLGASLQPTARNLERLVHWREESRMRRQQWKRLEQRGLIEVDSARPGQEWVARITESGRIAFGGGRDVEAAWARPWDGHWRLVTFDLPREDNGLRMKLRRWMVSNWFGRMQGSVWISPDPIPALGELLENERIGATDFLVFEGAMVREFAPAELAEAAWDFAVINKNYRDYIDFTSRVQDHLSVSRLSPAKLRKVLHDDRQRWWAAVRSDPLLPEPLLPKSYQGREAWKLRRSLLRELEKKVAES